MTGLSGAWVAVWRRNFLVWRKLAGESIVGNIIEPLLYLLGFGFGFGAMLPDVDGVRYIAYLAGGIICYSTMLAASFEALYSGFSRMHVQRTWEGILNAPVSLEDVVFAEWIWAASKSVLSAIAVVLVAIALGLGHSWTMVLIAPVAFLIGLTFSGLGLIMTALAKSYDFFMYWFSLVLTPMMLFSGVFYPLANMPPWLQALANALPLAHSIALGRPLLLGRWPDAPLVHIAVLAAYAFAGYWVALVLLRRRLTT
ncbi:MAG TPA: ABC transporter permease [Usitatibacter sp.]|jgi:lipooligosaccharide transport system permease protein|nr:ABC transporter permease [Usitatibacter sp.]